MATLQIILSDLNKILNIKKLIFFDMILAPPPGGAWGQLPPRYATALMLHMFNFIFRILAISSASQCFLYFFPQIHFLSKISTFPLFCIYFLYCIYCRFTFR